MTLKQWEGMTSAQRAVWVREQGAAKQPTKKRVKKEKRPADMVSQRATFVIKGRPASKKNSLTIGKLGNGRPILIQHKRYRDWAKSAISQLNEQWGRNPIGRAVELSAAFYEHPRQRFDLAGVFQALSDVLQDAEVIVNDRLVRASGPMAIHRDSNAPRIEFSLTTIGTI